MKLKVVHEEETNMSNLKNKWNELNYLFVQNELSALKCKDTKEKKINEALDQVGIFQINLGVALNDYEFE